MTELKSLEGTKIYTRFGFANFLQVLDNGLAQYMVRCEGHAKYFNIDVNDTEYTILGGRHRK